MRFGRLRLASLRSTIVLTAAPFLFSLVPTNFAQEANFKNIRLLDSPGGLGNTLITENGTKPGGQKLFQFPAPGGSNETSDILTGDFNGDLAQDILVGSLKSDEIALFLGRGNGSFVRADLGLNIAGTGLAATYSDTLAWHGNPQLAAAGRVVSLALVSEFDSAKGFSRVAAAVDYNLPANLTDEAPLGDQVVYLNINPAGIAINFNRPENHFLLNQSAFTRFAGNPVAVAVGNLTTTGTDVAVLCSGAATNAAVGGGFLSLDRGANGTLDQQIGGGSNPLSPVVPESGISGSLYDCRSYGKTVGDNSNLYDFALARANRRLFTVTPLPDSPSAITPRAVTFGNAAHRPDGLSDLFFVAMDGGSAGDGPSIATPAKSGPLAGAVFCLVNDGKGNLLRNARRQDEDFDFGTEAPRDFGQQDGVIIPVGQRPAGVALGDFNEDGASDVAVSNAETGTVTIAQSGLISLIQQNTLPAGPQIGGYPKERVSALSVEGNPNTIYVRDLNRDGKPDILGTNGKTSSAYVLFGGTVPGSFETGVVQLFGSTSNPNLNSPGPARALSVGTDGGKGVDFNPGSAPNLPDIVFSLTSTTENLAVRYGRSLETKTVSFGPITLSSFVGVVSGRLDQDTLPDIAICDRGANRVIVLYNSEKGLATSTKSKVIDLTEDFPALETSNLNSIDLGDVDGNGTLDMVVAADGKEGSVFVCYNIDGFATTAPTFTIRRYPFGVDATNVKLADLTGDGAPEIVALDQKNRTVTTLTNNGTGIFMPAKSQPVPLGLIPRAQTLGDFDDDGKVDSAVLLEKESDPTNPGDASLVMILHGTGDGSFQPNPNSIPTNGVTSIVAAGYGVVRNGIQVDLPDLNLDGKTDLVVYSHRGGGPTSDVRNSYGTNESASSNILYGSQTLPGQFTRSSSPRPLIDTLNTGGRVAIYPTVGSTTAGTPFGSVTMTLDGDFNQNGRLDCYYGGVEYNNGSVPMVGFKPLPNGFAGGFLQYDFLANAFGSQRTLLVYPAATSDVFTVNGTVPTDLDAITGVATAGYYIVSATGHIVDQRTNDLDPGIGTALPDLVQCTLNGRVYESIHPGRVLNNQDRLVNHTPLVTTTQGLADFNGPGRKIILAEGAEMSLTLKAQDIEPATTSRVSFRLVRSNGFVTLTDNRNGTATVSIKPRPGDGSNTENGGLGRVYEFQAEALDNDLFLPLASEVFFRIFVKETNAPSLLPIPNQTVAASQTVTVPVTATGFSSPVRLTTNFTAPFATFLDQGQGKGLFTFKPTDADAGMYVVQVTGTTGSGQSAQQSFKLTVTVNTAPVVAPLPNLTLTEGEPQEVPLFATDSDPGQKLTFSVTGLPAFATFTDFGNGKASIRFVPQTGNQGMYIISVTATDNGTPPKISSVVTFAVTVRPKIVISAAAFANRRLKIQGNGLGSSPLILVNDQAVASNRIMTGGTESQVTAKGNKKSLGLRTGANTIQIKDSAGRSSNLFTLNLVE